MNEFDSPSHFLLMFTSGVEETRRWLEAMTTLVEFRSRRFLLKLILRAQEEFHTLQISAPNSSLYGNNVFEHEIYINNYKFKYK